MLVPEFRITLLLKKVIARDVIEFRFSKPTGFVFQAGQFLQFKIPKENGVVLRSYSIASVPQEEWLDVCLKVVPGGTASIFLSALEIGDVVEIQGPEGRFVCEPTHAPRKVFVATGSGLAPMMSMIPDQAMLAKENTQLELWFGVRSEEDVFWQDRFDELVKNKSFFKYHVTLSQPNKPALWPGLVGRVTEHVRATSELTDYYLCGSLPMVKDVRTILVAGGVAPKQIHFEIF